MTAFQPEFHIEPLGDHDRAAFSCGVEPLDRYLKQQASQDARRNVAVPFVLSTADRRVIGYYTLSSAAINGDDLPPEFIKKMKLPRYPELPATLIGRLAVDQGYRGQGLGELLLLHALNRAFLGSQQVASLGVIVDTKDESSKRFYLHYGFLSFPEQERRLFLPMLTIEQLFTSEA
ncbi:MAG: GNAT family N-acetyltransferase [Bryobacteraceae bacterium]|nr:GNAT family N-acetyltransferase [Bryobacteraceae bacterium]